MPVGPRSNGHADPSRIHWWLAKERKHMNIFYIIGVVVVVLAVFGYLRLG
jgi:hypothetical protein